MKLLKVLDPAQNILSKINTIVDLIEDWKSEYRKLPDDELKLRTKYFLKRIELGETVDDLLPEAMATIREAAYRIHNMFAYRVQLVGALIIYEGNFAEMKTGEGKTLTITLAAYIAALNKNGVHVVTVNEYLVKRDAEFCRKILNFLGMTVGFNTGALSKHLKREMFKCDITYTTNSELAFDYLRDNMVNNSNEIVIPKLNFAIIDEGDSILIDEAGTPLIISVPSDDAIAGYVDVDMAIKSLNEQDYTINWETRSVVLLTSGILKVEQELKVKKLYSFENSLLVNKVHNALLANFVFFNGREYIIKDNKIVLIDQFTGRLLSDRSYNNGLQQAIQAKEYLKIENENKIAAKITYQSFFRLYKKIAALSGTAASESKEFSENYNMLVIKVPTNKPIKRADLPDVMFGNKSAKVKAIVDEIKKHYLTGQPVLVGTSSVNESEIIYDKLIKDEIPCEVLNAKNHDREAEIIANAGAKHAITIATNIAGRGVDIKINDEIEQLGGLYVLGCEKNESSRVDDQLRGRSGRQGDSGKSIFFISLEDDIFKRFGADKFEKLSKKLKDEHFDSKFLSKTLNGIQKRIQSANYDQRKNLIEYNEILSLQQQIIYKQRLFILKNPDNYEIIKNIINKLIGHFVEKYLGINKELKDKTEELTKHLNDWLFSYPLFLKTDFLNKSQEWSTNFLKKILLFAFEIKMEKLKELNTNEVLKEIMIRNIDFEWQKHLEIAEKIKNSINLHSMEQKSPLNIYVEKIGSIFEKLLISCRNNIIKEIFKLPNSFFEEECFKYAEELRNPKH